MLATDILTVTPTCSSPARKSGDSPAVLDSLDAVVANASRFLLIPPPSNRASLVLYRFPLQADQRSLVGIVVTCENSINSL